MDAYEDFLDLQDFYNNQKQTWETLRKALNRFRPNKTAIEKDEAASTALKRLEEIVSAKSPYSMVKEVSTLVATVEWFNEKLITEKQTSAMDEIDHKIKQAFKLLNEKGADNHFKNKTLLPLQNFKKKIETEFSIPQISYSVNESQEMFEDALETIDEKFAPVIVPDKNNNNPIPPVKKTTTIKPANFKQKAYLDTKEDVNVFIETVKSELLKAINENLRIRVL